VLTRHSCRFADQVVSGRSGGFAGDAGMDRLSAWYRWRPGGGGGRPAL